MRVRGEGQCVGGEWGVSVWVRRGVQYAWRFVGRGLVCRVEGI